MKCLKNLDLENNDVTKEKGYKEAVWNMCPSLEVLDNHDRDGVEQLSVFDEDYGEEGEFEIDSELEGKLTEEQLAELKRRGISPEDFLNGVGDSEDGEEDDFDGFEGGEDDLDDSDEDDLSEEIVAKQ